MAEEKPFNWVDQSAHFGSCLVLTLISLGFGFLIVILWAITREYYQTKETMTEVYRVQEVKHKPSFNAVMDQVKLFKRDLKFSYAGVIAGLFISIPFDIWLF